MNGTELLRLKQQLNEKNLQLLELRGEVMAQGTAVQDVLGERDTTIAKLRKELTILQHSMPPSVVDTSAMKALHRRVRSALSETGVLRSQTHRLETELANKTASMGVMQHALDQARAEGTQGAIRLRQLVHF